MGLTGAQQAALYHGRKRRRTAGPMIGVVLVETLSDTEARVVVRTNTGNGTLAWVVLQGATEVASDNQPVTEASVADQEIDLDGLTAATEYTVRITHTDALGRSSRTVTSPPFTTDA